MATIIFPVERAEQIAERAYEIDRSGGRHLQLLHRNIFKRVIFPF